MPDRTEATAGCVGMMAVIIALLIFLVLIGGDILTRLNDAQAGRQQARAMELRAQADLEYTRSVAWEQRFAYWSAFIEANDGDAGPVLVAILGAVVTFAAFAGGYTLGTKAERR